MRKDWNYRSMYVTLIKGDGIGPEITESLKKVVSSLKVDIEFEEINAGLSVFEKEGVYIPQTLFDSIKKNKIAIKGPITTPIGHGFRSINVELRKKFDLYANIRPIKSPGPLDLKFDGVDMVIFRENTEDLYAGVEEMVSDNEAHSIKIITREKSERIIKAAFEYVRANKREKVSVISKANIMLGIVHVNNLFFSMTLVASALLALTYLMPVILIAFKKDIVNEEFQERGEANYMMRIPLVMTAVISVILGIMPNFGVNLYTLAKMAAIGIFG